MWPVESVRMKNMNGITAFVTGASQGIGAELAVNFAEWGANVALAARSEGIYETAERIGDGRQTLAVETDITDERNVKASIAQTIDTFGGLDLLVNNAGIAGPTAPVERIDTEQWQQTTDVKVLGPFLCLKHSLEHLRNSDRGTVVNIASIGGKMAAPNRSPYGAANMAMIGMGRAWAHELGDAGITVNTICPGPVDVPRLQRVIEAMAEEKDESYEHIRDTMFLGDNAIEEIVQPEEIAEMIAYLTSDAGRHITAQDLNISGGAAWY